MEIAFGATASLVTLGEISKKALDLRRRYKHASLELQRAVERVALQSVRLEALRDIDKELSLRPVTAQSSRKLLNASVTDAITTLCTVQKMLSGDKFTATRMNKLRWIATTKAAYDDLTRHLDSIDASVTMAFQLVQWYAVVQIRKEL